MLSGVLSNHNFAFSFGFRRALTGKRGSTCRLFENLTPTRAKKSVICYPAESVRSKHSSSGTLSLRPSSGRISESSTQTQVLGMKHRAMTASSTTAASGDLVVSSGIISSCGSGLRSGTSSSVYFSNRTLSVCQNASLNLTDGDSRRSGLIRTLGKFRCWNQHVGSWLQSYMTPSSNNYSSGALPDVSHDGSWPEEQIASLAISDDQKTLGDRKLRLFSGSFYLPHPDKEATGGEDAHFICEDEQAIGVADGVGGWADVGVNAGIYSSELMSNSVKAIRGLPKKLINPAQVLEKAHADTKSMGSATACIIVLVDQGLHAINLGDSGFIVVRDGHTIFESPVQQHGFNFPYQLESGSNSDLPSSGQIFEVSVSAGDVIVAGTDGLFDNLYNHEINAIVANSLAAKLTPGETAQKIAALARERAHDKHRQTPFSAAAQQAGLVFYGGKLDDVTVVVSYITSYNPSHKTSNDTSS